jgi:hypothetical protein
MHESGAISASNGLSILGRNEIQRSREERRSYREVVGLKYLLK